MSLEGHTDLVSSVVISPDNSKIVFGSWDKTIKFWNRDNIKCCLRCKFDETMVLSKSRNFVALGGSLGVFVGMDLHKNYLQIAVMNDKGKVLENSRINNHLRQVGRFF
jgi:WD40 repeat protein